MELRANGKRETENWEKEIDPCAHGDVLCLDFLHIGVLAVMLSCSFARWWCRGKLGKGYTERSVSFLTTACASEMVSK